MQRFAANFDLWFNFAFDAFVYFYAYRPLSQREILIVSQFVTLRTRTHVTVWLVDWVLVIASHCFQVSAIGSSVRRLYITLRSFSLFWENFEEISVVN